METPEIIDGLKDLVKDRESFIDQNEPDNVFEHDKEVLKAAIDALSAASGNKPLTCEGCKHISTVHFEYPCDSCMRLRVDRYEREEN